MPRRITDDSQRKVNVSVSIRDALRQMVLAEADSLNLTFSGALESVLMAGLLAQGYPEAIVKGPGHDEYSTEAKAKVLENYNKAGNITEAARRSNLSLTTVYRWMKEDTEFVKEIERMRATHHGVMTGAHRSKIDMATIAREKEPKPETLVNAPGESWEDFVARGGDGFTWVEHDEGEENL